MRLVTFNILHGRSPHDRRVDVRRYAEAVGSLEADVLALQEVDRNQPRSGKADLTAVAAEAMGAVEHRFVAALSGLPGTWTAAAGDDPPDAPAYGIALLSKYPVTGWEVVRLAPVPKPVPMWWRGARRPSLVRDEPRVALAATVQAPGRTLTIVNTHLSFLRWWNGRQLRTLLQALDRSQATMLVGDLNMQPRRAHRMTGMRPLAAHATFPAQRPFEQIDHVLTDVDLEVEHSEARRLPISDHRALVVDVAL